MSSIKPQQQQVWDWKAAANFILGGAGTGLMLFASIDGLTGGGAFRIAAVVAFCLVAVGLSLILLKIGRPLRFLNAFFNPQTSWMAREAYAALPYFGAAAVAVLVDSSLIGLAAAVFGLLFLYCQARILKACKGVPAWRAPWTVPLVMITGLVEGAGLMVAISAFGAAAPAWLTVTFAGLVLVRMSIFAAYRSRLSSDGAPLDVLRRLTRVNSTMLLAGFIIPLALSAAVLLHLTGTPVLALLAGFAGVLSGWDLKFSLVRRLGHYQGMAISVAPARGGGSAGPGTRPGW